MMHLGNGDMENQTEFCLLLLVWSMLLSHCDVSHVCCTLCKPEAFCFMLVFYVCVFYVLLLA